MFGGYDTTNHNHDVVGATRYMIELVGYALWLSFSLTNMFT